jgi:endonuclease/exonuclease/phosphatase family metal-dependent hydrolase
VFAVHLYAGTKPKDTLIRAEQLAPLLETLDAEAGPDPVLLAGDINASPTVGYPEQPGPENPLTPEYAALAEAGFIDPLPPNPTPVDRSATWVPSRNRYAALPYQETKTDQTVIDGEGAFLSDHVGLMINLDLVASKPSRR